MSRETDSSSSGRRRGRGGSSYPPGTEPYGTGSAGEPPEGAAVRDSDDDAESGGQAEERKTETTMTTRIRINIPGSRPIPPVVMRTPVAEDGSADADSDSGPGSREGPGSGSGPGAASGSGSDSGPGRGADAGPRSESGHAQGSGASHASDSAVGTGSNTGSVGGSSRTAGPTTGGSGVVAEQARTSGASESGPGSGEFTQETSDWFAPRKPKSRPSPASPPASWDAGSGATGPGAASPYGTADPYDTGSSPLGHPETPPDGSPALGGPGAGAPGAGAPGGPGPSGDTTGGVPYSAIRGYLDDPGNGTPSDGTPAVGGPTTGPVSGDMRVPPARPFTGADSAEPAADSTLGLGTGRAPFAPGGSGESLLGGGVRNGDRTDPGDAEGDRAVGEPVVSGVPDGASDTGSSATPTGLVPSVPAPSQSESSPSSQPSSHGGRRGRGSRGGRTGSGSARRGRSKLVVLGAGLVGAAAVVYCTGLLLDHADVPKRTRVLGVDIGGLSKHEAVRKLNGALGDRTTKPFTVVVNGKRTALKPGVAGLTMSTEKSVRNAAGHDYNPVSVVGSIFGVDRVAEPAIRLDDEKMASAVSRVYRQSGGGGAPKDGMIRFVHGKVVKEPGKPHKGIDPDRAGRVLRKVYRKRAAEGGNPAVTLPVSMQQPKVGAEELDRAAKRFGKPAMSGMVTVKAGHASIKFSPQKSLPKFLSMKPVNGTLVDTYDLRELKRLYGTTFSGVRLTRSDGSKTRVTPRDVAGALRIALKQTDPDKRVQQLSGKTS